MADVSAVVSSPGVDPGRPPGHDGLSVARLPVPPRGPGGESGDRTHGRLSPPRRSKPLPSHSATSPSRRDGDAPWCTRQVLTLRPPRCELGALPLSYWCVVPATGVEPATSRLQGEHSATELHRRGGPRELTALVVPRGADPRASGMSGRRSTAELRDRMSDPGGRTRRGARARAGSAPARFPDTVGAFRTSVRGP